MYKQIIVVVITAVEMAALHKKAVVAITTIIAAVTIIATNAVAITAAIIIKIAVAIAEIAVANICICINSY